ncbi:MAG TPA: hypothetical protein DDW55_14980 [Gammaproteobacteria bacterium]|nr:hypothetical protein [Gammaproteobacteria bacterium]
MKASKTILASAALLVAPLSLQADDSFKDTYQFGTGSKGPMTHELSLSDTYRFELTSAYDSHTGQPTSNERADIAVFETKQGSSEPAIRGYIGIY